MTKVIGLTGGPGTGKTTAAGFFKSLGASVIDADKIVHGLYARNGEIKKAVQRAFGREVFTGERIDRKKLGQVVFTDRRKLRKLCGIVHPAVIRKIKKEIKRSGKPVVILDAPLLMEAGLDKKMDYVAVVTCSLREEVRRCLRKGVARRDIFARISAQMPLSEKAERADFIINNNRSKRKTKKEIEKIWLRLKQKQ